MRLTSMMLKVALTTVMLVRLCACDALDPKHRQHENRTDESARKRFFVNSIKRYTKYLTRLAILEMFTTHEAERYSPNVGYEPYWAGGDWVMQNLVTTTPGQITTTVPIVCGVECDEIYLNSGPVCASHPGQSLYVDYWTCIPGGVFSSMTYETWCSFPDPVLPFAYKTFSNFCMFLKSRHCKIPNTIHNTYFFAHMGKCIENKWSQNYHTEMLGRLSTWVNGLSSRWKAMNVTGEYPQWYTKGVKTVNP